MISQTIVLSQGALWKHRMFRDSPNPKQNSEITAPSEQVASSIIEWQILGHLFDLYQALLEVGIHELKVQPPVDAPKDDLAQRITAIFRRTLPGLRIASKWLKANIKYLLRNPELIAHQAAETIEDINHSRSRHNTKRFWKKLAEFLTSLSRAFPEKKLPLLTEPLEEDIEMKGFSPLKDLMGEVKSLERNSPSGSLDQAQDVHPNTLQLMRISDLLQDARDLADNKVNIHLLSRRCSATDLPSHSFRTLLSINLIVYLYLANILSQICNLWTTHMLKTMLLKFATRRCSLRSEIFALIVRTTMTIT